MILCSGWLWRLSWRKQDVEKLDQSKLVLWDGEHIISVPGVYTYSIACLNRPG